LVTIEHADENLVGRIKIQLNSEDVTEQKVAMIKTLCQTHRGKSPIYVAIRTDKGSVMATANKNLTVTPNLDFCRKMKQIVGDKNFQLSK
jgi:hypothetical protein